MSTTNDESKNTIICCFCGKTITGWGNNPWPANKDENARCCNECNEEIVIPARIERMDWR